MRTFRAEFYAPLSVTLHAVPLCIDVSLAFAMYVDIRSGGDEFRKKAFVLHKSYVIGLSFTHSTSPIHLFNK